jgi:hypothetical protein
MWDGKAVDEAVKAGVREALARHRREGRKIVVWMDNKPVWIDPPAEETE